MPACFEERKRGGYNSHDLGVDSSYLVALMLCFGFRFGVSWVGIAYLKSEGESELNCDGNG